jgi:hypothetical protein
MSEIVFPNNIRFMEPEKSSERVRDSLRDSKAVYECTASKQTVELDDGRVVDAPFVDVLVKEPDFDSSKIKALLLEELEDIIVIEENDEEGSFRIHYTYRVNNENIAPLVD